MTSWQPCWWSRTKVVFSSGNLTLFFKVKYSRNIPLFWPPTCPTCHMSTCPRYPFSVVPWKNGSNGTVSIDVLNEKRFLSTYYILLPIMSLYYRLWKFHVSVSSPCLFYTCNKLLYSILSVSCLFFCELYVNNSGSHRSTHWQIFHFRIICM